MKNQLKNLKKIMKSKKINSRSVPTIALLIFLGAGCASPGKRTLTGAGIGTAAGAGIGAIAGGGRGALIGAGIGAVAGGAVGNRLDRQANELAKIAETKRTADGILVNLKNDLLFETGGATLKEPAVNQLSELSNILTQYPKDRIEVAGFTDSTGTSTKNDALSMHRAQAVKDVLLQHGVNGDRITTEGFGQSKPIASNTSRDGKAKNRRVEIYITDPSAK